jgi:hypothetical protein
VSPRGLLAITAALALAACESPEAHRRLGGGPGADVGNRGPTVELHEGSQPYWETPRLIGDAGMPDLAPAGQARQVTERQPRR